MALEWLRRNDPKMDEHLRTFLFKEGPITEIESDHEQGRRWRRRRRQDRCGSDGSLGIGSLRKKSDQVTK